MAGAAERKSKIVKLQIEDGGAKALRFCYNLGAHPLFPPGKKLWYNSAKIGNGEFLHMKRFAFFVAAFAVSSLFAATVTPNGSTLEIVLEGGETYQLPATECGQLHANVYSDVQVSGAGTLTVASVFVGYTGAIHLGDGITLLENINNGLGTRAKCTVYVGRGASLAINIPSGVQVWHKTVIADGGTFDCRRASITIYGEFEIEGDLTITGGSNSPSFRDGVINLNGHTLSCEKFTYLDPARVDNPGRIEVTTAGTIYGPAHHDHYGTNLVLSLPAGSTYRYQTGSFLDGAYTNRCEWTLVCAGNLTFQGNFGDTAYHGPIILPSTATFSVSFNAGVSRITLDGPVTCGTLSRGYSLSSTQVLFLNATNRIGLISSGELSSTKGRIFAQYRQSLPDDLDNLQLPEDTSGSGANPEYGLVIAGSTETKPGWTGAEAKELFEHFKAKKVWIGLGALEGEHTNITVADGDWDNYSFYIGAFGGGTARLTGAFDNAANKEFYQMSADSTLELASIDTETDHTYYVSPLAGRIRLGDFGSVALKSTSSNGFLLQNKNSMANPVRFVLGSGTSATVSQHLRVGTGLSARAAIEVDGGALTNAQQVMVPGKNNGATGGAFLRGGDWKMQSLLTMAYETGCLGYFELSGGRLVDSTVKIGGSDNTLCPAYAQFFVTGGELVHDATKSYEYFSVGSGGTGVYHQVSGTASFDEGFGVPRSCGSDSQDYGNGLLTLAGGTLTCAQEVRLADRRYSCGQINLNGGVLTAKSIYRTAGLVKQGTASTYEGETYNTTAYLTFNGGTFKARADKQQIFGSAPAVPDRTVVYPGGLTVDTDGFDASVDAVLEAPGSTGVSAIALPDDGAVLSGYIVAPYVLIEGTGTGASAVAEFDSVKGEVTGVTVTCPGWGYDETTTAKLVWGQDSLTRSVIDLVVTIAANPATGGLTKSGEGTLTLNAANTYGGATVVRGGTLKLGVANALPANAVVKTQGGAIDVAQGVDYPAGLSFDLTGVELDPTRKYVLAHNWTGDIPTVTGISAPWVVQLRANGDLIVCQPKGLMLLLR